jgi:hypothetical protein
MAVGLGGGAATAVRAPGAAAAIAACVVLGGSLVFVASIIGDVKSRAFEDKTSSSGNGAFDFAFTPRLLWTEVFGTNSQGLFRHGLKLFECVTAF